MIKSPTELLGNEYVIPWGEIGYITYKRTYARRIAENSEKTEEFNQTIERCLNACDSQLGVGFSEDERSELKSYLTNLKCSFAGRFLWQLGTKTVDNLGLFSLQNCAGIVVDEPVKPFTWCMDALMLGSGVGFNIQREYVYQLPKPKRVKVSRNDTKDADFIIPDSRAGWVDLLKRVLEAHFVTGEGFSYSTICIREKGKPIKGFGGVAAGAEDLCWGMTEISKILNSRANKKMRPIDCLDIMNIIGMIVVSGNVRRSAQIALGDMDDLQFLNAKNWSEGNIPNWRAMSNNSVVCNDINRLPDQFWKNYLGEGERYGLINLQNARKMGRVGETQYPDEDVVVFNPCQPAFAPVTLASGKVITMKELNVGDVLLNQFNKETVVTKKWSTGVKPVYAYGLTGGTFIGTMNHRLPCKDIYTRIVEKRPVDEIYESFGKLQVLSDKHGYQQLDSKAYLGEHEVFDITVSDDTHTYLTNGVYASNCAEQSLENKETCCLAEVFLPNVPSYDEFISIIKYLYRVNKHSLTLKCHSKETEEVVHKNMRMGIGVTGYLQCTQEQKNWLSPAYEELRKFDKWYSELKGFPQSIKLTTCKPSGTLSLLAGVTPGAHPGFSEYYLRRVRMASNSPLVDLCRKSGYDIEYQKQFDGADDRNTVVVSFPCKFPKYTKFANEMSAIDQLNTVKELQTNWSDNAVSVTVYYKEEELPEIKTWLKMNYNDSIKTLSFLPHKEHGFVQAPLEEITEEQYVQYKARTIPINSAEVSESDMEEVGNCNGGVCPIK